MIIERKKTILSLTLLIILFSLISFEKALADTCYTCDSDGNCVAHGINPDDCFHVPGGDDCIDSDGNKYECHHKYLGDSQYCGGTYCGPSCAETSSGCDCSSCVGGNGGDTHMECDANCNCVEVSGSGTSECSVSEHCYPCGTCIPCNCGISLASSEGGDTFASAGCADNGSASLAADEPSVLGETEIAAADWEESSESEEDDIEVRAERLLDGGFLLSSIVEFISGLIRRIKLAITY